MNTNWLRDPILWRVLTALFVLAVPFFLVTSDVRWAFNSLRLYQYDFDKFRITDNTGISHDELMRAARQIRDYFNNDEEFLDVRVKLNGVDTSIYGPREILHMKDVKGLVIGVYKVQEGAAAYILAFALLGFVAWKREFWRRLARVAFWGSVVTIAFVVIVGLMALVGFGWLFTLFHMLSFANNLWMLDPYTSYLLRMFPFGFWYDSTLYIGLAAIIEALIVGVPSWLALRRFAQPKPSESPSPASTTPT